MTAPFTLTMEGYDFAQDPGGTPYIHEIIARRSDGSFVSVSSDPGTNGDPERSLRFGDGRGYWLYDGIKAIVQWQALPETRLAWWKQQVANPPAGCVYSAEANIGQDVILGHLVDVVRPPSVAGEQDTDWRAPDLGCQALRHRAEIEQADGSFRIKAEEDAVALTTGDPDANLFDLPSDYASMKPSDAARLLVQSRGQAWTPDMEKSSDRLDYMAAGQPVPASLR